MADERHNFELRGLLQVAGVDGTAVEIPNRYWPDDPCYDKVRSPWLKVYTRAGVVVLGWRKRVISIDWSDSAIEKHGRHVVADASWITFGERMCHAWSLGEAAKCLLRLFDTSPTRIDTASALIAAAEAKEPDDV